MDTFHTWIDPQDEAGALCLRFANTLDWHASAHPVETLHHYGDLVAWAQAAALLSSEEALALQKLAAAQPAAAATVYAAAIALREAIYRTFSARSGQATSTVPLSTADLALINEQYRRAATHLELLPWDGAFRWRWLAVANALDALLWPVVWSTVELLMSPWLDRVKVCEDARGCGYLFIDTSKNRSRRWCSMESCGNRAKVQRHRARHKAPQQQRAL